MSRNNLDGKDDFDEQLRMQKLYGDTQDRDTQKGPVRENNSFGQQLDDTPYEWDLDKKAWFPKITEDFIATYQANYGFSNDGASSSTANVQYVNARPAEEPPQRKNPEPTDPKKRGEKRKAESGWFHVEEDRNTNVYVSGLPPDITLDEFIQLMSKFGIIMRDPQTEEFKVKLYKDNQGNLKGDGLCCYLKRESVDLALKLLDEDEIRGYRLHVEVAKFQLKGEYDASKKKKKCKDYKKKLSQQQKQLDWRPERKDGSIRMRHERVVIIKNMFHPMDFEDDPLVLNEIREDLRVECSKFGQIRKLLLFDRHPDGVASVSFREPEEADYCIQTLDGRWFGGRQITAQVWDGTTDYQVEETTREREERLKGWEAFLESPEANKGLRRSNSICASERAGPSRVRHFSECPSTSKMNDEEADTQMEFEEPVDEKNFEKSEDEGEFEEDTEESSLKNEAEKRYPQKEYEEGCLERKSEEGCPQKEFEEGGPKNESKVNGPGRESKKKLLKSDFEENGLKKESKEDGPNKESEEDESEREAEEDYSEKLFEDGSEKEFEENGLRKEFDENGSDDFSGSFLEKELEENDSERSQFDDDSSEKVIDEEGSEKGFDDEESDENGEEDTYEKVFDDESDGKESKEDADEKMFEYSDEKEGEVDAKEDEEGIDENMFEDDEDSSEKSDDSDEKGTVCRMGNVREERALSTCSSFILSSDDDDNDDDDDDDDDDEGFFGPALPPGFKKQDDSPPRPIIGPALPPGFIKSAQKSDKGRDDPGHQVSSYFNSKETDSSEDEDIVGPMPAKGPLNYSVTAEFDKRAQRMKEKLTKGDDDSAKPITRESWMTELPPELKDFGLGPRTFKRRTDVKSGDRSVWTDTPADRERKAKETKEARKSFNKKDEEHILSGREKRLAEQVSSYNESKRSESLMDIHQKKLKTKAAEDKNKPQERIPFDRDKDLKVHRFDEAQKKALIRKSRELNTRFSHGKGSMFL